MPETVQVTVEKINHQGKFISKVVFLKKEISKPRRNHRYWLFSLRANRYSKVHSR